MNDKYTLLAVPLNELQTLIETAVANALKSSKPLDESALNSADIQEILKISPSTLFKWRKDKTIPFNKIGNTILYNKADVLAALAQHK